MKKILFILVLILNLFLIQSCESKKENQETIYSSIVETECFDTIETQFNDDTTIKYTIKVLQIDSIEYLKAEQKANPKSEKIKKINDFNEARKKLKGIVEFNENDEDGESHLVKKINFRNGKIYGAPDNYDYNYFVAYFPDEDILLCEGGHTTDVSFNLKTGEETPDIGNPNMIRTSPKKNFRLNGSYGGQECSSYFIQQKVGNEYKKVVELDVNFKEITNVWLCIVLDSFWADEQTLYITEGSDYTENGVNKRYFKIDLVKY